MALKISRKERKFKESFGDGNCHLFSIDSLQKPLLCTYRIFLQARTKLGCESHLKSTFSMAPSSRTLRGLNIVSSRSEFEGLDRQDENNEISNSENEQARDNSTGLNDSNGRRRYRKRGRTTMASIYNLGSNDRIHVQVDKYGVPCTDEGAKLASFLGTVAINGKFAPLDIPRWDHPNFKAFHGDILKLVQEKFVYPPETKRWILKSVNTKWRNYKCDLRAQYYDPLIPKEQIHANVPLGVEPTQWRSLVNSWYTKKSQVMSEKNKANAKKMKNPHTCGRTSFARKRKQMEKETGKAPDRLSFYRAAHMRKDGTYVDDNAKALMEKAFALQAERSQNSNVDQEIVNEQIFQDLFGPEHNGRVRGLGLGPTPTSYFGKTSYNVGQRWEHESNMCQKSEVEELKVQLKTMSTKYETVVGTLQVLMGIMRNKFPECVFSDANDYQDEELGSDGHLRSPHNYPYSDDSDGSFVPASPN